MLPECSLTKYICLNVFDYNAIIVYFSVLKPGWYTVLSLVLPIGPVARLVDVRTRNKKMRCLEMDAKHE